MSTYATSSTTQPDSDEYGTGYQLCEFCVSRGKPRNNPPSVCDCTSISRGVSGPNTVDDRFDTVIRIAETAVVDHWAAFWNDSVTIQKSIVPGQCNDEYSVEIHFDGTLSSNISESYENEDGVARIKSFHGEGKVSIGVRLTEDQTPQSS